MCTIAIRCRLIAIALTGAFCPLSQVSCLGWKMPLCWKRFRVSDLTSTNQHRPARMGLCSSSTSHDNTTTMGSTFTSMEDDNKHNPNSSTSSTATNKNRSARYNNSSHHDNPDPSPSSSSTSSSTSYASIHQEPINDILVGRTTTEEIFTCSDDNTVCLLNTATTGTAQVVHRWSEHISLVRLKKSILNFGLFSKNIKWNF